MHAHRTTIYAAAITAVLVLTTGMGTADSPQDQDDTPDDRRVILDPIAIRETIVAGDPLILPTYRDNVTFTSFEPAVGSSRILDADGELERTHESNVWRMWDENGTTTGTILANGKWVSYRVDGPRGSSSVEPYSDGPRGTDTTHDYRVGEVPDRSADSAPTTGQETFSSQGFSAMSGVSKTTVAYVDSPFVNQYGGMTWPDQVDYITSWASAYLGDAGVSLSAPSKAVNDPGTTNWDTVKTWIDQQSDQGEDIKSYWTYREMDGSAIGQSFLDKWALFQHKPSTWQGVPGSDFERAHLVTHEFGHVWSATHDDAWGDWGCCHKHTSFMWGNMINHLHDCWSSTNLNRLTNHLGTSATWPPCN